MYFNELGILRWIHIICMVYWLGGEWGVFQTSYNVINRKLPMEERKRHMETAYRIDILARSGIIMLLPLGLHMGNLWGVQPFGGNWLTLMWVLFAGWLGLAWAAFLYRESDTGLKLTQIDEKIRFLVIPVLFICAVASLLGHGPFLAGESQKWFAAKVLIYSLMLVIGLKLRFIMREWTVMFRRLAVEKDTVGLEAVLERSIRTGRRLAYLYWVGIGTVAFLAAVKPF